MTQRRTRHRPPRNRSALADAEPFGSLKYQLNEAAPGVDRCAWPHCREAMEVVHPGNGQVLPTRYGVLCKTHAVDVAIAVIKDQVDHSRVERFFDSQTEQRTVRVAQWQAEDERYEAEKAALRGNREGFVYYLMVGERLKIGYSVDVKRRMRAYPPGSELLAVEPGDRDLETQRHRQFAGSRTDGREWFRPTPDILDLVGEIVATYGEPRRFAHHYRRNQQPVQVRRAS